MQRRNHNTLAAGRGDPEDDPDAIVPLTDSNENYEPSIELNWLQAVHTLLPSRQSYGTQLRPKKGTTLKRRNPLYSAFTLPSKPFSMDMHPHVLVSLQRQLSTASLGRKNRGKSTRLSRHSFRFLQKATGLGDGDAGNYINFASEMAAEEGLSDQEYLMTIRSLPVSMRDKRQVRAKLLQSPEHATGWDHQQRKAKKRVKDLWKELLPYLYIWNKPMKIIEGQYGTGVVSYFVFLRWLLYLNLAIFWLVFFFIVLPQSIGFFYPTQFRSQIENKVTPTITTQLYTSSSHHWSEATNNISKGSLDDIFQYCEPLGWDPYRTHTCKELYITNVNNKTNNGIKRLLDLLQGTGFLENTALFPGWYNPLVRNILLPGIKSYNLALAYILVTVIYFLLCLFMMVGYTTQSVRESLKMSEGHLHKYCNLVFGGWDYCIEERKPADRKHQSIIQELKSNLAEERRQAEIDGWSKRKLLTVYLGRMLAHLLVLAILVGTLYAIYWVCDRALSQENTVGEADLKRLLVEFSPSLTVTVFNIILPFIFGQIVRMENYSIDFEIKITLIRTVVIRLASVVSLIATFYLQINCENENRDLQCKYCTKLQLHCWENYVGQQIYKLVLLDFFVVVGSVFLMDFPRKLIVKYCNCKLSRFIGYQEFDISKNVLDLVYSQTLCWLGSFYSPLLPSICVIKFFVFFYVKKLTLLVNYVPSKIPYRASRSNTFFVIVLMMSFILSVVPVGFTMAEFPPSMGCGPFRGNSQKIWDTIACAVESSRSKVLQDILNFLVSAVFGVPAFIILCLAIYYYSTVSEANRQMVLVLKEQLVLEGKDKSFLLARLTEVTKLHRLPNT